MWCTTPKTRASASADAFLWLAAGSSNTVRSLGRKTHDAILICTEKMPASAIRAAALAKRSLAEYIRDYSGKGKTAFPSFPVVSTCEVPEPALADPRWGGMR